MLQKMGSHGIEGYLTKIQKHTQNKYLRDQNYTKTFFGCAVNVILSAAVKFEFANFVFPTVVANAMLENRFVLHLHQNFNLQCAQ